MIKIQKYLRKKTFRKISSKWLENFLERLSVYLSTLVSFDILKQMEDLFQMVGKEFPFDEYTKISLKILVS